MFIKEQFIGREEIIKIINKRIFDFKDGFRQNIAITGDKLIGKTWIVKYVLENLSERRIIPLYFDLNQPNVNTFVLRFIASLLSNFLKTKDISLAQDNIEELIIQTRFFAPKTASKIENIIPEIQNNKIDIAIFRDLLSLLESLNEETNNLFIVIFEDFENLELLKIRNIFQELGKKIMIQKNTMYIITSSRKNRSKQIIQDELSLLFGNFETIEVGNSNNKICELLIKSRCKNIDINQDIINFLFNFTGGHPFYLDIIAKQIYQTSLTMQNSEVSTFTLMLSLEEILFNKWGILNLHFQGYADTILNRNRSDILNILLLLCQGKNKLKDLSSILHKKYNEINQKLSKLIDSNIISRSGSFYSISDRVFNFWLRFVYLEKLHSISQDHKDQVINFRRKIEQSLIEFIKDSKKDFNQRLLELLTLFDNDSVQIEKNKIILSQFKEIKPLNFEGNFIRRGFYCQSKDSHWLIALHQGEITENCVADFIKESKKIQKDTTKTRRIIIGLNKAEINARLLAKEEKILTWDIEYINTLMGLFGKPLLII